MLSDGRAALLLRPQIVSNLEQEHVQLALGKLDESMALVPEGQVVLRASHGDPTADDEEQAHSERPVHVEPLFLDRYPVTNRQFKAFVDAGGYEQIALWDQSVWPAILDFVDTTGQSGPRFWKDGTFLAGEADHPVVGVCWYEANAYARWVGKRLPSDPEWVKAGAWPVQVSGGKPLQRKFPWGDTMDRSFANLWGSGPGKTCSVREFNSGSTVGGVYQLIGNVWEWTSSNFGVWDPAHRRLETPAQMKSVRGGAFDTYFDSQANCQFQSGDSPMARKHNIGFRCALGVCDLGSLHGDAELSEPAVETEEELVAC
jgi:iron(II)-dependent oxidoreductase